MNGNHPVGFVVGLALFGFSVVASMPPSFINPLPGVDSENASDAVTALHPASLPNSGADKPLGPTSPRPSTTHRYGHAGKTGVRVLWHGHPMWVWWPSDDVANARVLFRDRLHTKFVR